MAKIVITAHSGCENTPLNSLESVLKGIEVGSDAVEIDIRSSHDKKPVLSHDPFMIVDGSNHTIGEHTYSSLQSDLTTAQISLPTIEEVLEIIATSSTILNIDMKDITSIDYVYKAVKQFNLLDQVVISGCDFLWAQEVTSAYRDVRVLLNSYYDESVNEDNYPTYAALLEQQAHALGACALNIDYRMCHEILVDYARKRFMPISVWTVDEVDVMKQMIDLGVDGITTYHPSLLRTLLM